MSQAGDKIEDLEAANARIADENKEVGVHEISQEDIDEMEKWDDKKLERLARAIAYIQDRRRRKASN